MASLPIRSTRLIWLSRLTRTHGQLSRAATCSIWVDLPVPLVAGDDDAAVLGEAGEDGDRGQLVEPVIRVGVRHVLIRLEKAGTSISLSMPNSWRMETFMSGKPDWAGPELVWRCDGQ